MEFVFTPLDPHLGSWIRNFKKTDTLFLLLTCRAAKKVPYSFFGHLMIHCNYCMLFCVAAFWKPYHYVKDLLHFRYLLVQYRYAIILFHLKYSKHGLATWLTAGH